MIKSFDDSETKKVWNRVYSKKLPENVQKHGRRKLLLLHAAETLGDLRVPPGNRLEKLRGNREGQHSIRINSQWRVCFTWYEGDAYDVEITDYH